MKRKLIVAAAFLLSVGSMLAQPTSWSEPQLFIKSSQGLMAPVWSPDGSQIAVTGDNFIGIWVANADGTNLKQISEAPGAGYQMRWDNNQEILSTPYTIENQKRMTRVERVNAGSGKISVEAQPTRNLKRSAVAGAGFRSVGSPRTLKIRPKVSLPTGTLIALPVSITGVPLLRPSVELIAIHLAVFDFGYVAVVTAVYP